MKRKLSKSKLSQYLRSQCDRQLYLSLFSDQEEIKAAGLPFPLKSRPGVQLITKSGREFEREQYEEMHRTMPDRVVCKNNGNADIDLREALTTSITATSYFILQPIFQPELFRTSALANLGLTAGEIGLIPLLAGLIPDALHVFKPGAGGGFEVLPNGTRRALADGDTRMGLSVIDLKNVTEANASYSAEVCLYAFFLSNWLSLQDDLKTRYFVSDRVYLWKHVEMPNFKYVQSLKASTDNKKVQALLQDLEDGLIDFVIYMPSVRKFFKEDVPRVISQGDTHGWQTVEYHVNQKCSACDWLGNVRWLTKEDKAIFEANQNNYCLPSSMVNDHLSKMVGLSKGASKILVNAGHSTVAGLVGMLSAAPVLRRHSLLKKERSQISERARALTTETITVDPDIKLGGLASNRDAEFSVIVNFDAGTGLLTGIAMRGMLFPEYGHEFNLPDGTTKNHFVFKAEAFVVAKDLPATEWVAVREFISMLAQWATQAQTMYQDRGWGTVKAQICFWEARQYEELCNAFGRHLLDILKLDDKSARALAWLFPAEELMEREQELAPGIVFISEIVDQAVRLPVSFVNTLLDVADVYSTDYRAESVDAYYREPLSNAIPRERIFEIWKSTTGTVRMFGEDQPITKAIEKYGQVLMNHTWALAGVTRRIRTDFARRLTGSAPPIQLSNPMGTRGVAYDSKLWMQWDSVQARSAIVQSKAEFIARADQLEASYKAVILTDFITDLGGNRYEFSIAEDSTEAKLDAGNSYYVLGIVSEVGFPLKTCASLGVTSPHFQGGDAYVPMYQVIRVLLESIDRVNRRAVIRLMQRSRATQVVFDAVMEQYINIETMRFYITDGIAYDDSRNTARILDAIGNPICSAPDLNTMAALGLQPKKIVAGTDANSSIARVLWEAVALSQAVIRNNDEANGLISYVDAQLVRQLNDSQKVAIRNCCTKQLSLIWGPPGTGKTDTLAALLHAFTYEGQTQSRTRKILITGPNYRAVDELAERLLDNLNSDNHCSVDLIWLYSSSREPRVLPECAGHLNAYSIQLGAGDAGIVRESLSDGNRVTIIATVAHNALRIAEQLHGVNCAPIQEIFDLVVIDESSQVPVTLALRPLCLLKPTAQVVIAGDHLQMPPIASLEAPKGAEYLVGSIQTYLIKRFNLQKSELLVNYRSNQDLVDFQKTLGYPQALIAHNPDRQLTAIQDIDAVLADLPASVIYTNAYKELLREDHRVITLIHDDIVSSQANEIEAKLVAGIAYCLRYTMSRDLSPLTPGSEPQPFDDETFFKKGLGVVTPHKAQKALVIRELQALFPDASPQTIFEAVDTVERFQGSQRQSIIVSFGVGDIDIISGEEEFLLQMERTNVSVSRAMAKCIVLMPKALAYHLPSDVKAVKTAKAIKSYVEEFCSHKQEIEIAEGEFLRNGEVRWH